MISPSIYETSIKHENFITHLCLQCKQISQILKRFNQHNKEILSLFTETFLLLHAKLGVQNQQEATLSQG